MGRALMVVVGGCLVFALVLGGCVAALSGGDPMNPTPASLGTGHESGPEVQSGLGGPRPERGDDVPRPRVVGLGGHRSGGERQRPVAHARLSTAVPMQTAPRGRCSSNPRPSRRTRSSVPVGPTLPTPYDPVDAVYSAARLLCTDGAGRTATLATAIGDYNHSLSYVETVVVLAQALAADPGMLADAASALAYAAAQLGTPYRLGWDRPRGFGLLGLTPAAYRATGIALPRVAQDQFDARAHGLRQCLGTARETCSSMGHRSTPSNTWASMSGRAR